jgi:DNA mismatch repair ATPase MutS
MEKFSAFFNQHKQQAVTLIASTKKQINLLTAFRLLVFVLIVWMVYLSFTNLLYVAFAVLLLTTFLLLMKQHQKANKKLAYQEQLHSICVNESNTFFSSKTGSDFLEVNHNYASDIDVLGEGSLFHALNRTSNPVAEKKLANLLLNPELKEAAITARQATTKELSTLPDFLLQYRIYSTLAATEKSTEQQFEQWLNQPQKLANKPWVIWAIWLTIAATITGIIAAFTFGYFGLIIGAVLFNWLWVGTLLRYSNKTQNIAGKQRSKFEQLVQLNKLVSAQQFSSETLNQIKQNYQQSTDAIESLNRLMATFDQRLNTMLGPILNSLFLFDVYCMWHIEKWKTQHGKTLLNWIETHAEFEAWVSMATYAYKHQHFIYPTISQKPLTFNAQDLAHPLIISHKSVANNFSYNSKQKVFIVTGSNMSGKSTFLRTVGLSLLCGMIGLPVQASNMEFSVVNILSSMRIADSLKSDTSYFYAELKRLKKIMDEIEMSEIPCVLFIDEMLKGTNSQEKLEGSIAIINKLVLKNCIAFIATHDLALGKLAETFPKEVNNYAFESVIENNEMCFDYKIKPQTARSTNATFLLRKMGIVN